MSPDGVTSACFGDKGVEPLELLALDHVPHVTIARALSLFGYHGFVVVTTGPRILRSDVACCVLLGLVHAALDALDEPFASGVV